MCGVVAPGPNDPWQLLCVNDYCDGTRHRWLDITDQEGDNA